MNEIYLASILTSPDSNNSLIRFSEDEFNFIVDGTAKILKFFIILSSESYI